jgi:hypothetical protein
MSCFNCAYERYKPTKQCYTDEDGQYEPSMCFTADFSPSMLYKREGG